jgi:hypothetical protein
VLVRRHSAKTSLPSVRSRALGKEYFKLKKIFAECQIVGTQQRSKIYNRRRRLVLLLYLSHSLLRLLSLTGRCYLTCSLTRRRALLHTPPPPPSPVAASLSLTRRRRLPGNAAARPARHRPPATVQAHPTRRAAAVRPRPRARPRPTLPPDRRLPTRARHAAAGPSPARSRPDHRRHEVAHAPPCKSR